MLISSVFGVINKRSHTRRPRQIVAIFQGVFVFLYLVVDVQTSPRRSHAWRCHSGAFHCFALPRFALTKRTVSLPCTALPTRGGTSQIVAVPALINALQFRRLSACADQSLVKNCPTQPSALRGRPFAQGAGWLIMVRMRWRSASGFSVPCSTTTSS